MYFALTCSRFLVYLTGKPKHCFLSTTSRQTLRIMKLTAILLTVFFLQVKADGISQTITYSGTGVPLEKVLSAIRQQSGYIFFYREDIWSDAKPVTLSVKNARIEEVLKVVFRDQPLSYIIEEKTVIISRKKLEKAESSFINSALPPEEIKGRVLTKEGEPLLSVNVVNKRTGKGTTTDANGNFSLRDVNSDDIIQISYTGFTPRTVKASEISNLTVILEPAISELDQVVMQAYGQTTRRFATGNIAKVTSEEISKQPVLNSLQALQGRVPGLVVTQTNGYGSAPFKVEIRGRNTISDLFSSDPLYIVDGVPLTISELANSSSYRYGSSGFLQNGISNPAGGQSPLFSINPADIESIEVLKDADATSIYGSRAANGAILITTKKGKAGKVRVNGSINQGVSSVTRKWETLNTQQYIEMREEAFQNDGIAITPVNAYDITDWDNTKSVDWQEFMWGKTGKATDAQLDVSGGNSQTVYRVGGGYNRRTDITNFSGGDERFSVSSSLSMKSANHRFSAQFANTFSYTKSDMIVMGSPNAALLPPTAPAVLDSVGKLNYAGWKPAEYPFASLFQPYVSKTKFLNSNLTLNYELIKGLNLRSSFGYNSAQVKQKKLTPISSLDPTLPTKPTGSAIFGTNEISNWIIEPQIEYSSIIGRGKLSALIGTTFQSNATEGRSVTGSGYTSDLLINTISNAPNKNANDFYGQYRYSAFFGRVTYNLLNRYIVNLSARRDGSSRFGEKKQFGNFGAIGAAWIFSEESFVKKNISFLSFGKIRGSYGTTGSDAVGDYRYLTRWSSTGVQAYGGVSSLLPLQHANDQYHWSTNKKLEAALEIGLLQDRLTFSSAWYRNRCNDQLVSFPIAGYTGFGFVTANSPANVQNTGWEFSLGWKVIDNKNVRWSVSFNTGINRNKLLSYPNIEQSPYSGLYVVGQPLNIVKLLRSTGVDPQTGLYTFEDKNKDGSIKVAFDSTDDRYVFDANPKFVGGIGSNLEVKGVQISLFLNVFKQKGVNSLYAVGITPGTMYNMPTYVFDNRWRKPGDNSAIAKFTTVGDPSYANFQSSDAAYTDASYIRLSNISISYSLPQSFVKRAKLQGLRLYLNAQNLLTITNYKGLDPETQNFGSMPPAKIITAGINFNF